MLTGIHFLLTYTCNYECDHCFLYCSPRSKGTFTLKQISKVLDEAEKIGTIEWIYFEGGEPLMFYPLLLNAIRMATDRGFKTAIVSNAYMTTSMEDAELWIQPLFDAGLSTMSISDDSFHSEKEYSPAKMALAAVKKLGLPSGAICIEAPVVVENDSEEGDKGAPVVGGGALFKGRAVEKLTAGMPRRSWGELTECKHEELKEPKRVHVDSYGHVHICQGVIMGNMWKTPLAKLVNEYNPEKHPICTPLIQGGPALLAQEYGVDHDDSYVDECHFCYETRLMLKGRFPEYLAPDQVYGDE